MTKYDTSAYDDMFDDYIEIADNSIKVEYKRELNMLKGLTPKQIERFGGTTSQMNDIIKEINDAKSSNLAQAQLISNVKQLGESTYQLAKKASALIP